MLTQEEQKFIEYWQVQRERQSRLSYQFLAGIPYGLLFSLPIALNFIAGRFWYKRADAVGMSQFNPLVLVLAVLIMTCFVSVLYKRFRWEQHEQRFQELITRKDDPS
jgi:uncharacterized membrane protein